MNDLISRKAFIKELYNNTKLGFYGEFTDGSEVAYTYNDIVKAINEQTTAYDVNKIVEQLEEAKGEIALYGDDLDCYCNGLDTAIDIVNQTLGE